MAKTVPDTKKNSFHLPTGIRWINNFIWRNRKLFIHLGNLEAALLSGKLKRYPIDRPVYISGLARSGSTILLEFFSQLPEAGTHRYIDFPFIPTPWVWHTFLDAMPVNKGEMKERDHKDGIFINLDSPESMEEIVWMSFFDFLHDIHAPNLLDETFHHQKFEKFYRDHIRKILLMRKKPRFVSKANYNATRIRYLLKLFPDARFVLPVRDPVKHVAANIKQSRYIAGIQSGDSNILRHFRQSGHFEYGLDMRPVNAGAEHANDDIITLFEKKEEVRAWARYWSRYNRAIYEQVHHSPATEKACFLLRYDEFCSTPHAMLEKIAHHCELAYDKSYLQSFGDKIRVPAYYTSPLSEEDVAIVKEETDETARFFGF